MHCSRWRRVAVYALAMLSPVSLSDAQTIHRIDASLPQSCTRCTISLRKIATLGRIEDAEFPGVSITSDLGVDKTGRFYATSINADKILVYDRTGQLLKTIGRAGRGPGEFTSATKLALGPGDSLHVIDGFRIESFTPDGAYARNVNLFLLVNSPFVVFGAGSFGITSDPRVSGARTFAVVEPNGKLTQVGQVPEDPMRCPTCYRMLAASNAPRQLWTTLTSKYAIERWSRDGVFRDNVIVVKSPWMTDWSSPALPNISVPPKSMIRWVREDANDRLWVLGEIPKTTWKPNPPRPGAPTGFGRVNKPLGGTAPTAAQLERMITVVDVLDLKANRIYVSQSFPGQIMRLITPGLFARAYEDVNGIPVWDIYRAEITTPLPE